MDGGPPNNGPAQGPRAGVVTALQRVGAVAYGEGEYVGQESFASASELRRLALGAGVERTASVLDLCCGTAGPGLMLVREIGCRLVGIDSSLEAVMLARRQADSQQLGEQAAFLCADVLQLPLAARFDAVLLFETMLAIEDKAALLQEVGRLLQPGGRFGLTLEEGAPLSQPERQEMPGGDGIWLYPEAGFRVLLENAGFQPRRVEDYTAAHAGVAQRLAGAFEQDQAASRGILSEAAREDLAGAYRCWGKWLATRRVRKLAILAEFTA